MGYGSYHEDNLDAKGESAKGYVRVQTKAAEVVKKEVPITEPVEKEMPTDEIEGQPLTPAVAETILRQLAGKKSSWLTTEKWAESVRVCHEKNGGKPPAEDLVNIVFKALFSLFKKEHARVIAPDNSSGKWKVFHKNYSENRL